MKTNKNNKTEKLAPIEISFETKYLQALHIADILANELEQLRRRGDAIAVDLANKSSQEDSISHELIKCWWELRS